MKHRIGSKSKQAFSDCPNCGARHMTCMMNDGKCDDCRDENELERLTTLELLRCFVLGFPRPDIAYYEAELKRRGLTAETIRTEVEICLERISKNS